MCIVCVGVCILLKSSIILSQDIYCFIKIPDALTDCTIGFHSHLGSLTQTKKTMVWIKNLRWSYIALLVFYQICFLPLPYHTIHILHSIIYKRYIHTDKPYTDESLLFSKLAFWSQLQHGSWVCVVGRVSPHYQGILHNTSWMSYHLTQFCFCLRRRNDKFYRLGVSPASLPASYPDFLSKSQV